MKHISKRRMYISLFFVLLILFAYGCGQIPLQESFQQIKTFLILIRSSIYVFIFTAWGISIHYRIVSKSTANTLTTVAILIVIWVMLRTIKYTMTDSPVLLRYIWYSYYIPLLGIVLLSFLAISTIGKTSNYQFTRIYLIPVVITFALCLLVLTNDLHQFVFIFPSDAIVWSDHDYSYGLGYYGIFIWIISVAIAILVFLIRKCRLPTSYRKMSLPFIPLSLAIIYGALYVRNNQFIVQYLDDMTIILCMLTVGILECCIIGGFIPVNQNYRNFFIHSQLPIYILDQEDNIYLTSNSAPEINDSYINEVMETPILLQGQYRLSSSSIHGGHVLWMEDISQSIETVKQLQDIYDSLQQQHTLMKEEYRTNKQKIQLEESNRLYNLMQIETSQSLYRMEQLRKQLEQETDFTIQKNILLEMIFLGAYFKRRNNLLFIAETEHDAASLELLYCLNESIHTLELANIKGSANVRTDEKISIIVMMDLYDHFQDILIRTRNVLQSIVVIISNREDIYLMQVMISTIEPISFIDDTYEIEDEDDNQYVITYRCQRKEKVE